MEKRTQNEKCKEKHPQNLNWKMNKNQYASKKQLKKKQRKFFRDEGGESLLSKLSKSSSTMLKKKTKRQKPLRWSEGETNTFYKCLEFFGNDFDMITSVFHNKRKRQIMRKFNKERKRFPERIKTSLAKQKSNLIKKSEHNATFIDNFFGQTETSDDGESEDSFRLQTKNFAERETLNSNINLVNERPSNKNDVGGNIILEDLEEEDFERQIEQINTLNIDNDKGNNQSLNQILSDITREYPPNVIQPNSNPQSIFNTQNFCLNPSKQSNTKTNLTDLSGANFAQNEFLTSIPNPFEASNPTQNNFLMLPNFPDHVRETPKNNLNIQITEEEGNFFNQNDIHELFNERNIIDSFKALDNKLKEEDHFVLKPLQFYLDDEPDNDS